MSEKHPTHFNIIVRRHNLVVHMEDAPTRADAERQQRQLEAMEGVEVEIVEVHEAAEVDLTTHTRELLEDLRVER